MSTPRNLRSRPRPFAVRQTYAGTVGGVISWRSTQAKAEQVARAHFATIAEPCAVYQGESCLFSIAADGTETRAVRLQTVQELDALLSGVGCICGEIHDELKHTPTPSLYDLISDQLNGNKQF